MRNVVLTRLGRGFEITGTPYVANVGDSYSYTFGTTGGFGSITWTCTSLGSSGLTFSAGTLSGTCAASGDFPFTLTATDQNRAVATASFVLIILGSTIDALLDESGNDLLDESGAILVAE